MSRVDLGKFHKRAIEIFERENLGIQKQRVVAFVLDSKGHVLTEGWNSYSKTHPQQKRAALAKNKDENKCFLHAEVSALTKLSYKQLLKKNTIVVLRMDHKKNLVPGKPCVICSSLIEHYEIKNIIHS